LNLLFAITNCDRTDARLIEITRLRCRSAKGRAHPAIKHDPVGVYRVVGDKAFEFWAKALGRAK
jgi:hypothetical protein